MGRFFDEHEKQKTYSLSGHWDFLTDPRRVGEEEKWFLGLPKSTRVAVPSVWNTQLGLLEYEGAAWYQKRFYCEGGVIRLHFGAVMTAADIWMDGERLEGHYGGFCEFDRLCEVKEGYHLLTVRADNSFDADSIPQAMVDWYHYGGITREVSYEMLKGISVMSNRLEYELSADLERAVCHAVLELYNADDSEVCSTLSVFFDGGCVYSGKVTLGANESATVTTLDFTVTDIRLWNVGAPELYTLKIATDTYDVTDRVGFRRVEIKDGAITINGRAVEIRGVNRHEDHPDFGMAFPVSLMGRDLDIVEEMGANSIRGSHYPNSREFVDMLDERGILFWSEIPVWGVGFNEAAIGREGVIKRALSMHEEMIRHYYNHPSIIIWGMHNEIPSDTQNGYELTKSCCALLRRAGGNRLITHASSHPFNDICFEFDDFIAINTYYGWYNGSFDSWDGFAERLRARREELGMQDKPVLMSEFGAAAIYGHHTFDNIRWTEEYQAALLEKCLRLFHTDSMFCGFYIWQLCNIRTSREVGLNRARGFNNKGILDEYRRPKMAYFKVRDVIKSFDE